MTGWRQFVLRVQMALDRLAWGLGQIRRALVERGFWPAYEAAVVTAAGKPASIRETRLLPRSGKGKAAGLVVPETNCLSGEMRLPTMRRSDLEAAVQEALWRLSPIPPDQIAFAWDAAPDMQAGWQVQWLICRRSLQQDMLAQQGLAADVPVYLSHAGQVCAVRGVAWEAQKKRQRRMDGLTGAALLLVIAMLLAPALMPLVLKRQAVTLALQHVQGLEAQAAPLRQKLDELRSQARVGDEVLKSINAELPLASFIDRLSAALPDEAWLDRIEVNGREIRVMGLTGNANELLAQLGRQPGLADARATGASVRDNTLNKERFTFEMRWRADGAQP
ncbi:MAG: PilN domain-containing protein [Simplicispira suum]|uniref:Fimbrial protein n=2 Tax=Simplicispira suum TaxID=2109915 RepID=A0A2S0MXW4_9BURK|nr:PilN domain-containing protein [Simplicispira suum]AVO40729.1 fimbrial protein [Simplicispira suum]MBW7831905.1 PilN domain-containing protein [Simplicispira suum]